MDRTVRWKHATLIDLGSIGKRRQSELAFERSGYARTMQLMRSPSGIDSDASADITWQRVQGDVEECGTDFICRV